MATAALNLPDPYFLRIEPVFSILSPQVLQKIWQRIQKQVYDAETGNSRGELANF
jgi:hypothetical protein